MPRDLGKAKRADLTGHFPGEQAEYGSSFANFLEGAGQLTPLEDGTYLDTPAAGGNGRGNATEIPGLNTEAPGRGTDTEVAPRTVEGNGHTEGQGADIFDTHFGDSPFGSDEMMPEPAFADDALQPIEPSNGETEALEPVKFEPSAETLSPDNGEAEPELLDSVPDLTSPEHDLASDDSDDQDNTDLLDDPRRNRLQTIKPHTDELPQNRNQMADLEPADSSDTGMLIAEAFSPPPTGGWDEVDFDDDSEREKITDKISRAGPDAGKDEDLTSVHPRREEADGEKITNKVEPRRDVDPRASDPNAVVRDTVNFYNQTQSLHEQKKSSGGFPTISPNVVNSAQPLGLRPEAEDDDAPDLLADESDTLKPGPAFGVEDQLAPGPDDEPSLAAMPEPMSLDAETPALTPAAPEPAELAAESDLEDADKRETDKFKREDREPPDLPLPEGTDKVDKEAIARERARHEGGEPKGLEPLADEKVAGGKDTQRFYVAEILAKKDHTGDTTAELVPAEEGPPPMASSSETAPDLATEQPKAPVRRKAKRPEPEDLPEPAEVNTDFLEQVHVSHEDRIVPEIGADADFEDDDEADSDDTVDEEAIQPQAAEDDDRITEKLKLTAQPDGAPDAAEAASAVSNWVYPPQAAAASVRREIPSARPVAASAQRSDRVKKITDGLSRRLKQEREETLRLIEQAEAVAIKLREASENSRTDLEAISERRTEIRRRAPDLPEVSEPVEDEQPEAQESASAETVFEERPESLREEKPVTQSVRARPADRVPTRAIGEIVDELQRTAERAPASLSELLDEVSRREEVTASSRSGSNGHADDDDDLDLLVAASARLRETVESEWEEDRISGRAPAVEEDEPEPVESARRPAAESTLSADLDRLWEVLDSRRHSAAQATVVLPTVDKTRITPREDEPLEGWTQELLWPTLAGIAVATFILGALFVWMLLKAWA